MHKNKVNFALVLLLICSLFTMYVYTPPVTAASLTDAKDTLSDSDLGATATHTITFVIGEALYATETARATFNSNIDISGADITCVNAEFDQTASTSGQVVDCIVDIGQTIATSSTITIVVANAVNPSSQNYYDIDLATIGADDAAKETAEVMIYIINDVEVTASVDSTLSFTITGLDAGTDINGVTTNGTSTSTSIPFGTLGTTGSTTIGQQLAVTTNADDGFSVTVFENDELTSAAGSNINSFSNSPDNTGSSTPAAWSGPLATLDHTHTYGHMGLTSEDSTLAWGGGNPFNVGVETYYVGFNATSSVEVMYHNGPTTSTGDGIGVTQVAYTVEISSLQEAGDYANVLTYICTPQY